MSLKTIRQTLLIGGCEGAKDGPGEMCRTKPTCNCTTNYIRPVVFVYTDKEGMESQPCSKFNSRRTANVHMFSVTKRNWEIPYLGATWSLEAIMNKSLIRV